MPGAREGQSISQGSSNYWLEVRTTKKLDAQSAPQQQCKSDQERAGAQIEVMFGFTQHR
jgi:hypothetical protein